MKIVTWNVLNLNQDVKSIVEFIEGCDADVFALQELTETHVRALGQVKGFEHRTARDFKEAGEMTYLGLLSKFPIVDEKVIEFPRFSEYSPSAIGRAMKWEECFEAHAVTIEPDGAPLTIVNLHLTNAAPPRVRIQELERIVEQFKNCQRLVICGDFNTFATPLLNVLIGWQYSFRLTDLFIREISQLRAWAAERTLHLVDNRSPTFAGYRLLGFRLDHFLVRGIGIPSLTVEPKTFGSDHHPVMITT